MRRKPHDSRKRNGERVKLLIASKEEEGVVVAGVTVAGFARGRVKLLLVRILLALPLKLREVFALS